MRPLWASVTLLAVLVAAAPAAELIDDFERTEPGLSGPGVVQVAVAAVAEGDDAMAAGQAVEGLARGSALAIGWPDVHKAWVECAYAQPRAMPAIATLDSAVAIRVRMWLPAAPAVTELAVRLIDKHHETFQWSVKLAPGPAGWRTAVVAIDPRRPAGHWGGSNGGQMGLPLRLSGFGVTFVNSQVPAGRVLLDEVRVAPLPTVALATDRFPSLVNASGAARCDLVLANPTGRELRVAVGGTLTGWGGQAMPVDGALTVPAGGEGRLALPLGERQPGIRWLDYRLRLDDGSELAGRRAFVVADPVPRGGPDDFLFSICSHPERAPEAEQEQEMVAAAAAGATVVRVGCAWSSLEPQPGVWKWEVQDRLLDLAATYGLETQYLLGYGPSHAASPELRAAQAAAYKAGKGDAWKITLFGPPQDAPWRNYLAAVAGRYRGKIRYYEVWNEPDLGFWRGTTEQYIALLRSAHEELHKVDPAVRVMTGGFATVLDHPGRAANPDLQERVLAEAGDAFDVHAIHQHGPFDEFRRAVDGELMRLRKPLSPPRPLYFNETAISAYGDERAQALTLVKKGAYVLSLGAVGWTWYDLRNDGDDPREQEHNYGLLTRAFMPKPAFAAYGELVRRLHGLAPRGRLDIGPGCEAHAFGAARGRTVVWWNEARTAAELPVLLAMGDGAARAYDAMGVGRDLPRASGFVLAQPVAAPQYLDLPAGDGLPAATVLLRLGDGSGGELPPADGGPLALVARLANPLASPLTVRLAWRAPGGPATAEVVVPAGGTAQAPLTFAAPAAGAREQPVEVAYTVAGTPWSGTLRQRLPVVRSLGRQGPEGRAPDWTLASKEDVVDLAANDPALAAFTWRGPADLSAELWGWLDGDRLRLRIAVKDDRHVQREDAAGAWRGDGVQFAFQPPGARGFWELGVALGDDGKVLRSLWQTPVGGTAVIDDLQAEAVATADGVRYDVTLPAARFGLDAAALEQGFRFNLLVNDNDGTLRESFVRLAPGLGETKDVALFPSVRFPGPTAKPLSSEPAKPLPPAKP